MNYRTLHLTSPFTHGPDVRKLQLGLNARRISKVKVDGIYGLSTQHAVHVTAYALGLSNMTAVRRTQRLIENPALRSPLDYMRAARRKAAARPHSTGLAALPGRAMRFIGQHESPSGSNWGSPYPATWLKNFGLGPAPWCGAFAGSMILAGGGHVTSRVVFCPYIEQDARSHTGGFDAWTTDHRQAGPGWLVLYDWTGNKSYPEHVGIVESLGPDTLTAIEGNTSGTNPSDGGMVARMVRPYSEVVGFARPRF